MSLDPKLFASTFSLIFVAELPDKTAFATLVLATRNKPFAVFLGVAAAFLIQSAVAVLFGSVIGLLPPMAVRITAGALFLSFAWMMWRKREDVTGESVDTAGDRNGFLAAARTSFSVIFIAEWGDLTQLTTAALSARYDEKLTIFLGATTALWLVTALAILAGRQAGRFVRAAILTRIAAVAFAVMGILLLSGVNFR